MNELLNFSKDCFGTVIFSTVPKQSFNEKQNYLTIRGGSLKKIEKKIMPKVPTNKKV